MLPACIGMACFVVGIALGRGLQIEFMLWVGMVGFAAALVGLALAMFLIRCPACGGRLAQLILNQGVCASVPRRIRFCPYCGLEFDAEYSMPDENRL